VSGWSPRICLPALALTTPLRVAKIPIVSPGVCSLSRCDVYNLPPPGRRMTPGQVA
jgi:hypothetical protein